MNDTHFHWKRFWYPRGSSLNLADDGYLPDPDSQSSRFWNKQVVSFEEISALRALVLLGDPGMGKSTILSEQESVWGKKQNDSSEKCLFINLRSYQSDSRLAAHLFESPIFKEWLAGTHTLHLFLDSLDEGLLSIKVLAACLADEFKKLPSERLYLRIACRTVEWPDLLDTGLTDWLGKEIIQHYVLAPLRKKDVEEAARVFGLDAKSFLSQVESSAVVPFAIKPVTLNFLLSVYRNRGSLPSSQSALYLEGCRLLAAETSESRGAAGYKGELTAEQRLAVAARIAAAMIFGNRNAVYLGANPAEVLNEDVEIRELSAGTESADDGRFKVGEKEIRETLGTGLFSTRGPNRIGWGHQTYAEFLAAWYLKTHDVSTSQIKSLITHPDDPNKKIIPQLGETAAWLAGMTPEIFQSIVRAEPDLLLRSEVATGDSPQRAALVEALLKIYEDEHTYDHDRQQYKNLAHPGLADQLRPYIANKTKGVIVRRVAIDIAESCNIKTLNDVLLVVALDKSDNLASRVQAIRAIGKIGDDNTIKQLKPLALIDDPDDLRDELKGSVLWTLWPFHITARELFSHLRPPKSEGFIGVYRLFLSSELVKDLAPQDLIPALEFVTSLPQPRHEMDSAMESLMDGVVMKAWENMNGPGVTEALARFVGSRLKHHDDLIKGRMEQADHLTFLQDEDKRHRLLEAVLSVVAEDPEGESTWLVFTHIPIVRSADFYWLISYLDRNPNRESQRVVADLLSRLFDRSPEHLDAIHEVDKKYPLVADKFKSLWWPISLGSPHAQQLKARHEEEEAWKKQRDKLPLKPPPAERLARALQECEDCNPPAWWRITRELTLEPTSTDYNMGFEWDVVKLPGWLSADEATRERVVLVAEKYIQTDIPTSYDWLGTGQWTWSVLSQYSALALLQNVRPMAMQGLSTDQIGRWSPIILAFPFLNNDSDRSVKEELLKLAYRKSPLVVLDVAKALIEKEIEKGERIGTAIELNGIWDEQIANLLLWYAKSSEVKPKSMGSLLSLLFAHDNLEAQSFASSLIPIPPPEGDPERAKAVVAAQTLMLDTKDVGWGIVWPAVQADEDFGKQVILGICNDYDSMGFRLNEDQLADLYVWLTRHFEALPKDNSDEMRLVGPPVHIDMWENAIVQLLTHRGSFRACEAIKRIQRELPELGWLKWVQVDAEAEARRVTWVPAQPQDIVKLAVDHEMRLVQSGDQLLQVLVESLERFQALLQGERPEAPFLWDNVSKSDAKPKDENMFSDYVIAFLNKDLKQKGIILNREVRIHRGQRTDIHVDAVTQAAPGEPYDSITVIIECKGCWNPGLYDAMKDQLVGMYLKDNHCQHGLYLVGWFNCGNWSEEDGRKKQAWKLCPTIDHTRQRLTEFAADLSKDSIRIKSVVFDASLR
jgi:predicted NACHT family NTPase